MQKYIIDIKNVHKEFAEQRVLEDVNLQFEVGKIYGLVGKNGCGKSVLLKMIAGLIVPTEGSICIDGNRLKKGDYPEDTGVLLDCTGFLPELTGYENLRSLAEIRGIIGAKEIEEILEMVGLSDNAQKLYRKYSLGMKQKLAIAQAFMEKPRILLLDEPMNSLDESSVEDMRSMFKRYVEEYHAAMIITSHNKEDIESLCNYVYEIKNRKIVTSDR